SRACSKACRRRRGRRSQTASAMTGASRRASESGDGRPTVRKDGPQAVEVRDLDDLGAILRQPRDGERTAACAHLVPRAEHDLDERGTKEPRVSQVEHDHLWLCGLVDLENGGAKF